MTEINYDNRYYKMVSTSTGDREAIAHTVFHYRQKKDVVWGTYQGGSVAFGTLIGKVDDDGNLDLRFQHIYTDGQIKIGKCYATVTVLEDDRYRLDEKFQWLDTTDAREEHSVVEEFR